MIYSWHALFVENTTRCNLDCPACKRPKKNLDMEMETYKTILSKFTDEKTRTISFFWRGEPTNLYAEAGQGYADFVPQSLPSRETPRTPV